MDHESHRYTGRKCSVWQTELRPVMALHRNHLKPRNFQNYAPNRRSNLRFGNSLRHQVCSYFATAHNRGPRPPGKNLGVAEMVVGCMTDQDEIYPIQVLTFQCD